MVCRRFWVIVNILFFTTNNVSLALERKKMKERKKNEEERKKEKKEGRKKTSLHKKSKFYLQVNISDHCSDTIFEMF